jgi:hypothetical protein
MGVASMAWLCVLVASPGAPLASSGDGRFVAGAREYRCDAWLSVSGAVLRSVDGVRGSMFSGRSGYGASGRCSVAAGHFFPIRLIFLCLCVVARSGFWSWLAFRDIPRSRGRWRRLLGGVRFFWPRSSPVVSNG